MENQHFPMVFLWFSYGFPIFLWFSYGFPMVFRFSYGFPMVFLWFSDFPMVFLWFSCGFPMVFLWFSYGFPSWTIVLLSIHWDHSTWPSSVANRIPQERKPAAHVTEMSPMSHVDVRKNGSRLVASQKLRSIYIYIYICIYIYMYIYIYIWNIYIHCVEAWDILKLRNQKSRKSHHSALAEALAELLPWWEAMQPRCHQQRVLLWKQVA